MLQTKWKRPSTKIRVGKKLKDVRVKYGLTQKQVAKSIGCSPSAVSILENGKFGSFELIDSYVYVLGLDLGDL
jgi:transcriptional regulator with XRE-family HTH domain